MIHAHTIHVHIFSGPYYKFRTYYDMLHHNNTKNIDALGPALNRLKMIPIYASAFVVASEYITVNVSSVFVLFYCSTCNSCITSSNSCISNSSTVAPVADRVDAVLVADQADQYSAVVLVLAYFQSVWNIQLRQLRQKYQI